MMKLLDSTVSRRGFLSGAGAATIGLAGGTLLFTAKPGVAGTVTLSEQVDWTVSNRIMGETVAKELGYFEEQGIDLNVILGGPNIDGVASVASGRAEIGLLSSSPSLMLARAGGIPVTAVAAGFQQHPFTYFSLPAKPVRVPDDLRGKKVGTAQSAIILLKALLKKNNIPESEVTIVALGPDVSALLNGQVDVITNWATDATPLAPLGKDRVEMRLWDAGVRLYANNFYVTDSTLKERPDVVAGYIKGVAKGWAYIKENPEKAVEMFVKVYPVRDAQAELDSIGLALSYVFNETTAKDGWGTMSKDIWQDQLTMYNDLGQFEGRTVPTLDSVMTTAILEATADARPKLG
jgi:NitT/TauT family transport system substrate-binding protein